MVRAVQKFPSFQKHRRPRRSAMSKRLFLSTGTDEEIIRGFEFCADQLRIAAKDGYHWKWVLHGMQNLLQNMIMGYMSNTIQSNIRRNEAKYIEWVMSCFDERKAKTTLGIAYSSHNAWKP